MHPDMKLKETNKKETTTKKTVGGRFAVFLIVSSQIIFLKVYF